MYREGKAIRWSRNVALRVEPWGDVTYS